MPELLSACLMMMLLSEAKRARVRLSSWVRLGEKLLGCIDATCVFTLFRYASMAGLAGGGIQADFGLKGCGSCGGGVSKEELYSV